MNLRTIAIMAIALIVPRLSDAQNYSKDFTLTDSFGTTPFRVQNAFIRVEPFGTPVRYWQPSSPNIWGEVVYRFDTGFPVLSSSMFVSATAYTVGNSSGNFDNDAEVYVDISTDDVNYVTVLGAYPGHAEGYAGPGDISASVSGADTIYVRSRLFMTVDHGSFSAAQFLRGDPGATFNVSAVAVPEPAPTIIVMVGLLAYLIRRRGRTR